MEAQLGGSGGGGGGGGGGSRGGGGWKRVSAVYGDNVYGGSCVRTHSCAADTKGSGAQGTPRLHPRSAAVAFSHMRAWREVGGLQPNHNHNHNPNPNPNPNPASNPASNPAPNPNPKPNPNPNPNPDPDPDPDPNPNPEPEQVEALPLGGWDAAIVLEDDVKLVPGRASSTWLGLG